MQHFGGPVLAILGRHDALPGSEQPVVGFAVVHMAIFPTIGMGNVLVKHT